MSLPPRHGLASPGDPLASVAPAGDSDQRHGTRLVHPGWGDLPEDVTPSIPPLAPSPLPFPGDGGGGDLLPSLPFPMGLPLSPSSPPSPPSLSIEADNYR